MKKKMIYILIGMLLIASISSCIFGGATEIKNENIFNDVSEKGTSPATRGETFLYPPWPTYADWINKWSEGLGWAQANSDSTSYSGWAWTNIGVPDVGKASADAHFYHQPFEDVSTSFTAPCSGNYDLTIYYSYDGTIDLEIGQLIGTSFLEDYVYIWFVVAVFDEDLNWVKTLETKEIIEDGHWDFNHYKSFNEDIEISFTSIYLPKGYHITIDAQGYVWEYAAVVGLAWAGGEIELNGKLTQVKIVDPNDPPNKPAISGPKEGKVGASYTYKFKSTDPNGDNVLYCIEWGDGANTCWLGPYSSGYTASTDHAWDEMGYYQIKAKARDIHGAESGWSYYEIYMPRNKVRANICLLNLFEKLASAFPTLGYLFGG